MKTSRMRKLEENQTLVLLVPQHNDPLSGSAILSNRLARLGLARCLKPLVVFYVEIRLTLMKLVCSIKSDTEEEKTTTSCPVVLDSIPYFIFTQTIGEIFKTIDMSRYFLWVIDPSACVWSSYEANKQTANIPHMQTVSALLLRSM